MKRFTLFALLILGTVALATAQGWGHHGRGHGFGPGTQRHRELSRRISEINREAVTVTGDLTLVQGFMTVKSGDISYLVLGLNRHVGFIDALQYGARVSLEGTAIIIPQNENIRYLIPTKLTVGGMDFDIGRPIAPMHLRAPVEPRSFERRAPVEPRSPDRRR